MPVVINAYLPIATVSGSPPSFGAAGAITTTGTGLGLTTVAYPASISAGDYLELSVAVSSVVGVTVNTPAGWTQVYQAAAPSNTVQLAVFYKFASGSESGTLSLTSSGTINGKTASVICRYGGVNAVTPYEVVTTHVSTDAVALNGNAVTTAGANRLLVDKFTSSVGVSMTPGTGWTEDFDGLLGGAGTDIFIGGTHKAAAGSGSVSAEAATHNGGFGIEYLAFTYALITA